MQHANPLLLPLPQGGDFSYLGQQAFAPRFRLNPPVDPAGDWLSGVIFDPRREPGQILQFLLPLTTEGDGAYNSAQVQNSTNTLADITGLKFPVRAGETYIARAILGCTGPAAGIKFGASGPASPTALKATLQINTSAVTVWSGDGYTAFATQSNVACCTGSSSGVCYQDILFRNGANAGTFQLQFASVTSTQTSTVNANAFLRWWRITA